MFFLCYFIRFRAVSQLWLNPSPSQYSRIKKAQEASKPIITLKTGENYITQILDILGGFFRVHVGLQSSVLLPEFVRGHKDSTHANDTIPQFHAIAMIWFHCALTSHKYYITGHADRFGSEDFNMEI